MYEDEFTRITGNIVVALVIGGAMLVGAIVGGLALYMNGWFNWYREAGVVVYEFFTVFYAIPSLNERHSQKS